MTSWWISISSPGLSKSIVVLQWIIRRQSQKGKEHSKFRLVKMVLEDCLKVVLDGKKRGR